MYIPRKFRRALLKNAGNIKNWLADLSAYQVLKLFRLTLPQWAYVKRQFRFLIAWQRDIEWFDALPDSAWKQRNKDLYGEGNYWMEWNGWHMTPTRPVRDTYPTEQDLTDDENEN
jgi:hypothetical protein